MQKYNETQHDLNSVCSHLTRGYLIRLQRGPSWRCKKLVSFPAIFELGSPLQSLQVSVAAIARLALRHFSSVIDKELLYQRR
jgi:hypothetical protein